MSILFSLFLEKNSQSFEKVRFINQKLYRFQYLPKAKPSILFESCLNIFRDDSNQLSRHLQTSATNNADSLNPINNAPKEIFMEGSKSNHIFSSFPGTSLPALWVPGSLGMTGAHTEFCLTKKANKSLRDFLLGKSLTFTQKEFIEALSRDNDLDVRVQPTMISVIGKTSGAESVEIPLRNKYKFYPHAEVVVDAENSMVVTKIKITRFGDEEEIAIRLSPRLSQLILTAVDADSQLESPLDLDVPLYAISELDCLTVGPVADLSEFWSSGNMVVLITTGLEDMEDLIENIKTNLGKRRWD